MTGRAEDTRQFGDYRYLEFIVDCCVALRVSVDDVIARRRYPRSVVLARHVIAWGLRQRFALSFPHAARLLGGRDHTTMMHSVRSVEAALASGKPWALEMVAAIPAAEVAAE